MPQDRKPSIGDKKAKRIVFGSDLFINTSELGNGELWIDSRRYNHTSSSALATILVPEGATFKRLKQRLTYKIETSGLGHGKLYIDGREYITPPLDSELGPEQKSKSTSKSKSMSEAELKSRSSKSKSTIKQELERKSKSKPPPRVPTPPSAADPPRPSKSYSQAHPRIYDVPPIPTSEYRHGTNYPPYPLYSPHQPYPPRQPYYSQPYPPNAYFQGAPQAYGAPPPRPPYPNNPPFSAPPQQYHFHPLDPRASGVPVTKRKEEPDVVRVTDPNTKESKHLTRDELIDLGVRHYNISRENAKKAADELFKMHKPIYYPDGSVGPSVVQMKEIGECRRR